jgi:hypothetical protein
MSLQTEIQKRKSYRNTYGRNSNNTATTPIIASGTDWFFLGFNASASGALHYHTAAAGLLPSRS